MSEEIMLHEVLGNARTILAERGHTKYRAEARDGSVCVGQALYLGGKGAFQSCSRAVLVLPLVAQALGFEGYLQMVDWNNEPERTLEDVLDRLDQAIEATVPELLPA